MIGRIFAVADQAGERIPAICKRNSLHRRRQVKADDRRRVGAGQLGESRQNRWCRRPLLCRQLNRPGANSRVWVGERMFDRGRIAQAGNGVLRQQNA